MKPELEQRVPSDPNINADGWLRVSNTHEIYWVDWGNAASTSPIFYLHGGPGAGFDENDFRRFDPLKHRVIFHDQRGAGRSRPYASTKQNTTEDLLHDITALKDHLGLQTISLFGFSWGSTLGLLYAIKHPASIDTMLIGGIFLARKRDCDYFLQGGVATHFPEAWQQFVAAVPQSQRHNIAEYYGQMLSSKTAAAERMALARSWMRFESSLLRLEYQPATIERSLQDFSAASLAYIEVHYLLHKYFIEDNYIINNAAALQTIKIVIVQGRYDFVCPPQAAYELQQAVGDNAKLHLVTAGHSTGDPVQREVIKAYVSQLWDKS